MSRYLTAIQVTVLVFITAAPNVNAAFSMEDYKKAMEKNNKVDPKSFEKIPPKEVDFLAAIKKNEERIVSSQSSIKELEENVVKAVADLPALKNSVDHTAKKYNDALTYYNYKKTKLITKRKNDCKISLDVATENHKAKEKEIESLKSKITKHKKNILSYQNKIKAYTIKQKQLIEPQEVEGVKDGKI